MPNTATLTKAMLADLHKGNASISLLPCPANGQVAYEGLDFSGADQIFSTRDSFTIASADVTSTNIQIDQFDEIIDTEFTEGDYTMNANIPSMAKEVLEYFYNEGAAIEVAGTTSEPTGGIKGQDGTLYEGQAFAERKELYCSVLVESASKKTAVVFGRVRVTVNPPSRDNNTDPAYLKFVGTIVANLKAGEGNFAVLKKHVAA